MIDTAGQELTAQLASLLGQTVNSVQRIGGGMNSRVFLLECESGQQFAAKQYHRDGVDPRDRLVTEFQSLQFLWENGVRDIPGPIAANHDLGWAVFEYISGSRLAPQRIGDSDIDAAVDFLGQLRDLTEAEGSDALPAASDACFSLEAIVQNIEGRLAGLSGGGVPEIDQTSLAQFLETEFSPAFDEIRRWSESRLTRNGLSYSTELPRRQRTLSPSDFGFHNAVRRDDGRVIFLDFEYFGWDDPAKTVCDFLLHPAMNLEMAHKRRFVQGALHKFEQGQELTERIKTVYPLFGLKWCLIFLNEFLPAKLARREFASQSSLETKELQAVQLAKSAAMLHRVKAEYERFPYHD